MKRKTQDMPGFTLVELLVVIAIISVLAALLFPAAARVRNRGTETACISNLRQIGSAFRMYMQDHDEFRPPQLDTLVGAYITSPALLKCGADAYGNYAYLSWGWNGADTPWSYPISYDYFAPSSTWWTALEARSSRAGYLFDRCHGEPTGKQGSKVFTYYTGHTLRVNMDGSVVSREIHYPNPATLTDVWYLSNYNPGEAIPPLPEAKD